MCGILGITKVKEKEKFKKALDTLAHRGPDDYGIEAINDEILLGHRRLSILDLSSQGHQPMFDKTKNFCIVFNGEIYNFLEIRKELESKGYRFSSNSDTEVLLNSYIEWGEKCVLRFNGMWAFAIWNKKTRELFLSRDRFGKKPLFYAIVGDRFVFASEMKAIFPFLQEVKPSKYFQWMKNNVFSYEGTDKCLIEGIKRFPHGHSGTFKNGKLSIKRYWNTLDNLVEVPKKYNEQVEVFRELFFDACRIRMRSDVPIGTALSGGLDSSSTISTMSALAKKKANSNISDWQHAFVASFPNTPLDESYYAKLVVDNIGIDATYIDINPIKYWDNLEKYLYMFEELYITSPIPMLATYEKVKEHGISVTLDGHGADELFSGYGHALEALWDTKMSITETLDVLETHKSTLDTNPQFKIDSKFMMYIKYFKKNLLKKTYREMKGIKTIYCKDKDHPNFEKFDNLSQVLYVIFHETILPTLLRNYDRYSMMNGVEIRMPFMDHRLVSFVNSLPYTSKLGNGYTKKLIRDAMDPYMPKEVTWRKSKIGFHTPFIDWMQNELKEWFSDTVHDRDFLECKLLSNPCELQNDIMKIVNKQESSFLKSQNSWYNLSVYLWEKSVIKNSRN